MLPIVSYKVYWDKSYLLSGSFVLLAEVKAYDQPFFEVKNVTPGTLYKF